MPSPYEVPALRRARDVLDILARACAPVRVTTLVQQTGLSRSTLYLLLDSLAACRWIEKRNDGYIVGLKLFELGSTYVRHDGLQPAFRLEAGAFIAAHNEVVQLGVLDQLEVVYIAREDAQRPVRLVSDLGVRLPAHCCALGKALLGSLPDDKLVVLLPERLASLTARTTTRRGALLTELADVRKRGVATEHEEVSTGLACIASYVGVTPLGKRVAVSTSVPLDRLTVRREKQLTTAIARVASRIAERMMRG